MPFPRGKPEPNPCSSLVCNFCSQFLRLSLSRVRSLRLRPPERVNLNLSFSRPRPAGFNPVGASDADLAAYGFPKRPALTDPYYATWAKVVSNAKNRIANPVARTTTRVHGPVRQAVSGPVHAAGGVGADNGFSYNWSGPEVTYPNTSGYFARNGSTAYIAFQPPVLGTEDCLYAPYHTSIWAGFDGDSRLRSYDVLQAGVDVS